MISMTENTLQLRSLEKNSVIGSGKDASEALAEARKHHIENPFILYVPNKDMVQIY